MNEEIKCWNKLYSWTGCYYTDYLVQGLGPVKMFLNGFAKPRISAIGHSSTLGVS